MNSFEGHILIQQGSESLLKAALQSHQLNPNERFQQESLLASTIKRNAPNLLQILLEHGADADLVSYENARYEPPIITAVRYKSLTCVQLLLEYGANLGKTNFYGTDAIFQAVNENAFDILDYLLLKQKPHQLDNEVLPSLEPRNHEKPIVIQNMGEEMRGAGSQKEDRALKIQALSNATGAKGYAPDDHVLCPFYFALSHSVSYSCKRQSLVRLLQSYYKCKCLEEIASCTKSGSKTAGPPPTPTPTWLPTAASSAAAAAPHFPLEELLRNQARTWTRKSTEVEGKQVEKCLELATTLLLQERSEREKGVRGKKSGLFVQKTSHGVRALENSVDDGDAVVDLDNGDGIKLRNECYCAYKIYKIEGKCHAIKENESSPATRLSSSYVVLLGPLKLSCIVREVIRDQIMLYAKTTTTRGDARLPESVSPLEQFRRKREPLCNKAMRRTISFRQSLDTLNITLPAVLLDFLLYSYNGAEVKDIKLMKKDHLLNINYYAVCMY